MTIKIKNGKMKKRNDDQKISMEKMKRRKDDKK
jgi:hypothetical protein